MSIPNNNFELTNILSENCSRDNPSAEAEYVCAWNDRWECAATLVGGLIGNTIYGPQTYGPLSGLVCHDVKISKFGQVAGDIPLAKLVASFGISHCKDDQSQDLLDLAEITLEVSGEGAALPKSSVKWGSDAPSALIGQQLGEKDTEPQRMVPFIEAQIKIRLATDWRLDEISEIVGKVNNAPVSFAETTFVAEELVFFGVGISKTCTADGYEQFERAIKLGIRRKINGIGGWNMLYIPDQNKYAHTTPLMYELADFSPLFSNT